MALRVDHQACLRVAVCLRVAARLRVAAFIVKAAVMIPCEGACRTSLD